MKQKTKKVKRVGRGGAVIYCRVSTPEQAKNLSLDVQEKGCREWCARQGFPILKVFVERGVSAKTANRPELIQALAFCEKHQDVAFFVVYDVSRFSRNSGDYILLQRQMNERGVHLRSVLQQIDETLQGRFMGGFYSLQSNLDNDLRRRKQSVE